MEISLLKVLLSNISSLFNLSSHEEIKYEPAQKYYRITKEILNVLKPVLNIAFGADIASTDPLHMAIKELSHSVEELRELFENWHPLRSKIYFVLEVESYISKVKVSGLEILMLLRSSNYGLPIELDLSVMELCIQNIKHFTLEQTSVIVNEAIKEQKDGSEPSSETLEKYANNFSLKSNQELLIEGVALEKLKDNAEQDENNSEAEYYEQLIALVTNMHEQLFSTKQSEGSNPVPIPADFCCPLSLELMTDPVIVTSGQTYERAFIKKWIDIGLIVCPKTRQTLSHTNLVPNYTVKALIANFCENNNIKLPDPVTSANLKLPSYFALANQSTSTESTRSNELTRKDSVSSSEGSLPTVAQNGNEQNIESPNSPSSQGHSRNASATSSQGLVPDSNDISSSLPVTAYNSDNSGEQTSEPQPASKSPSTRRENVFPTRLEIRNRSQSMFRRPIPRIVSSPTLQTRADMSEIESQVKTLVENLKSSSLDEQKRATSEIRLLAKHNMDNRIVIASCGAIEHLVNLLHSPDTEIQENAVTALLNLSINDNNKAAIANLGAIEPLTYVLETGTPEAKENSAATLFSLSVVDENKARIGRSGAIKALVDLLGNGTPRGKKDASTALFNLSILHENKARIVQAGAVKYLVELMDPAAGMVDKAVAVLANLATTQEGRTAIGQEGGIPVLVEVVELGSARGKENAAAALLQLCTSSNRYCNMVIHEGAVPPLVALSQSGTPRAKEKAQALLSHFRNQRHVNAGRS